MTALHRTFVAVELPANARAGLAQIQASIGEWEGVRWTHPDRLHLTLRFLGDLDEAGTDSLIGAVGEVARGIRPFGMSIRGVGGFPTLVRARIVWAGVGEGVAPLEQLHDDLENQLRALRFPPADHSAFSPHVTIGRARPMKDVHLRDAFTGALARYGSSYEIAPAFGVAQVTVMRSELGAGGPRYTPVESLPLGSHSI